MNNPEKLEEFGAKYLIKALNRCSDKVQEEVSRELEKMAEEVETAP